MHYCKRTGQYMIHGVTGPNEYENNVNNNRYTNRLAAWELAYTAEQLMLIPREKRRRSASMPRKSSRFRKRSVRRCICRMTKSWMCSCGTTRSWIKTPLPASALSPEDRPLNQKWSWDRILRSCFTSGLGRTCFQGLYFLEHLYDKETIRRNFDFWLSQ
ncbi:MAG: hypothetical protein ACLUN5_17755 [Oscillospiraceae bacterium]